MPFHLMDTISRLLNALLIKALTTGEGRASTSTQCLPPANFYIVKNILAKNKWRINNEIQRGKFLKSEEPHLEHYKISGSPSICEILKR